MKVFFERRDPYLGSGLSRPNSFPQAFKLFKETYYSDVVTAPSLVRRLISVQWKMK